MNKLLLVFFSIPFLISCGASKQLTKSATQNIFSDTALQTAHVGISVYDPIANKYIYDYQGDKYFVPASNTKIATCYAAMKYLGDSLLAARVAIANDSTLEIYPTGDPTFLHPDFSWQPLFEEIKKFKKVRFNLSGWQAKQWGSGWSWSDYDEAYMAERSPFPVYGNLIKFYMTGDTLKSYSKNVALESDISGYDKTTHTVQSKNFSIDRSIGDNQFYLKPSTASFTKREFPFRTDFEFVSKILEDTSNAAISVFTDDYKSSKKNIYSQAVDSILKHMMHTSDNFFAEQALLMVSNEQLGIMNDAKIIDTLLKTEFSDLPQKPRWADGSGLSRYNLFTPQDLVSILNKMRVTFGMERIKQIFSTGNEGTLANYYKADKGYIFAKTGTLSGIVAISGFLYTKKDKLLIFSVLVNNHQASATAVRRAVEKFVEGIRETY